MEEHEVIFGIIVGVVIAGLIFSFLTKEPEIVEKTIYINKEIIKVEPVKDEVQFTIVCWEKETYEPYIEDYIVNGSIIFEDNFRRDEHENRIFYFKYPEMVYLDEYNYLGEFCSKILGEEWISKEYVEYCMYQKIDCSMRTLELELNKTVYIENTTVFSEIHRERFHVSPSIDYFEQELEQKMIEFIDSVVGS